MERSKLTDAQVRDLVKLAYAQGKVDAMSRTMTMVKQVQAAA